MVVSRTNIGSIIAEGALKPCNTQVDLVILITSLITHTHLHTEIAQINLGAQKCFVNGASTFINKIASLLKNSIIIISNEVVMTLF